MAGAMDGPFRASLPGDPRESAPNPRLLVDWTGGWEEFRETLRALTMPLPVLPARAALTAFQAEPVARGWPGRALAISLGLHALLVVVPLPQFLTRPPARQTALNRIRIEYDLRWAGKSKVLPPIAPIRRPKGRSRPAVRNNEPRRGADGVQPQTIVSNPPQPNHPRQTLLTEFGLETPRPQVGVPHLPNLVIPPALQMPRLDPARARPARVALNLGGATPLPPRPQSASELALAETRLENLYPRLTAAPASESSPSAPELAAPAGAAGSGDLAAAGVIALSAQPGLPTDVLELPQTNLRARFAVGPTAGSGEPGAEGPGGDGGGVLTAPDIVIAAAGPVPPGPVITGPGSASDTRQPPAPMSAPIPTPARPSTAASAPQESSQKLAEEILEGLRPGTHSGAASLRRVYTIYINMPNLASQAGSWVLRFAELGEASATSAGGAANGFALEPPVAVRKVDPRYPAEARRQGVEGIVSLYAIIREDGSVGNVAVVRSLHELLDHNAADAFLRWRFQPGRKNGLPVPLEVVVEIPFRLQKLF